MTGHEYERVVAAYLKHKGYSRVKVTKGSGDFGVDVIAHKGKKKYAVQCKYYKSPVSLDAVQEVIAGKVMYGCNAAMVVTNSTFTKAAEELAKQNGVVLISGVKSSGVGIKDILITAGVIGAVLLLFVLLAAGSAVVDTIKAQFESENYAQAVTNILSIICLLAVIVGLPIGVKYLIKHLKRKRAAIDTDSYRSEIPPSEPVKEYTARVDHNETARRLRILKAENPEIYSQLHTILHHLFASNHISISLLQRKMGFNFLRAEQTIAALEKVGFITPKSVDGKRTMTVSEQEAFALLSEIENSI